MGRRAVVVCEGCWRETDRVSYCLGCRLTLCTACRGDHIITCEGCTGSTLRGGRHVVALARCATQVLADAGREAETLAQRANEQAQWSRPASSGEYAAVLIETMQRDLEILLAKGQAAEVAGAFAAASLPSRSRRRGDELRDAEVRYRDASAAARRAIDSVAASTSQVTAAARRRVVWRRAMALAVLVIAAIGAVPVLERLF